jgi:beta-galactosidase
MSTKRPAFPYGAVYFRKSNPPQGDWKRDYAQARQDGMNTFRHWFMWSAIEIRPGVYDWADYDRQLDLAAENGIQTIIAEKIDFAPEWAYRTFAGCELQTVDGHKAASSVQVSSSVGGYPGLCLDHPEYRAAAERFLRALVERYKEHPGLGGYDLWNECNIPGQYCYCPATAEEFRRWLRDRYGSLEALGVAWNRYSLVEWADVRPPANSLGHAESLDWMQFRIDHGHELLRWRVELVREIDPDPRHVVTAHGIAASLTQLTENGVDDWRSAAEVESYGLTWVASRRGNEPWRQWNALDLVRSSARGKPFWHAEAQGGPLWLQPQVLGRTRDDGRVATPEDIRFWNFVSFAGGVRGLMYPRWRPLLNGPLFDAFGPYGLAGEPTDRSKMVSEIAKWCNDPHQAPLWAAKPIQAQVGIFMAPESQMMSRLLHGEVTRYTRDVWGVFRAFFDMNVQADYVRIEDIGRYDVLYLPMPVMLTTESCEALRQWVAGGGKLISEGCPGYFGDHGQVSVERPGGGLAEVFGVRELYAEFMPDLFDKGADEFYMGGRGVACGVVRQAYEPHGGRTVGVYSDGQTAAVEHEWGSGRALLVGTCVGETYDRSDGQQGREWFRSLLSWAGIEPHVQLAAEAGVTARLQQSEEDLFLWVTNPFSFHREVRVKLGSTWGPFSDAESYWGDTAAKVEGNEIALRVDGRDATVLRLRQELRP